MSESESSVALPADGRRGRLVARLWRVAPWLFIAAAAFISAALLPRLQDYVTHSCNALFFPWQLDYHEGVNANASWLLAQNVNIYRPNTPDRFISAPHPPLYYLLNAAAMKVWGLSLVSGRLLAFAGALGVGALLWAWVYVETKRHLGGLVAALMWLSLGPVYVWSTLYAPDMLALALGLAGGVLVARLHKRQVSADGSHERHSPARSSRLSFLSRFFNPLYWAIVPLSLSFWAKQSSIVPLAAVALFILLHDARLALRWMLAAVASIAVPFLAFDLYTGGGFSEHLTAFRHYDYSLPHFNDSVVTLWRYHAPLILCGLGAAALAIWVSVRRRHTPALSALYSLIAIPSALISFALPAANYAEPGPAGYGPFLSILAPLCLLFGMALSTALRGMTESGRGARLDWSCLTAGLLLLAAAQVGMIYRQPPAFWHPSLSIPLSERAQQMEGISRLIRATPGDVLSEDNWLLLKNDKLVIYDDPAAMSALARAGAWDQSALLRDLSSRRFSYVITRFALEDAEHRGRWSEQAWLALKASYETLQGESGTLVVSAPRSSP